MNYSVLRAEEQQPMFDVSSHPLSITLCVTERNQLVIKLAFTLFYMSGYYCREWVIIWGHFPSLPRGHVQHGDMLLLSSGWNQNWPHQLPYC